MTADSTVTIEPPPEELAALESAEAYLHDAEPQAILEWLFARYPQDVTLASDRPEGAAESCMQVHLRAQSPYRWTVAPSSLISPPVAASASIRELSSAWEHRSQPGALEPERQRQPPVDLRHHPAGERALLLSE